jgi:hypothetical protein
LKEPAHEEKNVRTFRHGSSRSRRRGLLILEFHYAGGVSHRSGIGGLRDQGHGNRPVLGLVLYIALQRYYIRGLTSGVVKG